MVAETQSLDIKQTHNQGSFMVHLVREKLRSMDINTNSGKVTDSMELQKKSQTFPSQLRSHEYLLIKLQLQCMLHFIKKTRHASIHDLTTSNSKYFLVGHPP